MSTTWTDIADNTITTNVADQAAASATAAATSATASATSATASASSSTSAAAQVTLAAAQVTLAAGQVSLATTQASNSATSATASAASLTSFQSIYHGAASTAPTSNLSTGDLWFDTSTGVDAMKVYDGSAWVAAYISAAGTLVASNNLSDVSNAATSRTNLGLGSVATQANNSVDIDGGAIDGTVIGGTTPAAVSGTTGNFSSTVNLTNAAPALNVGSSAVSTGAAYTKIGTGRTGDGLAYLDLIGDATYTDHGTRILREGGAGGYSAIQHRGTGIFYIQAIEAAAISINTSSTERMRILSGGNVGIGTSSPGQKLTVAGTIESTTGGIKFPDATTQTSAGASTGKAIAMAMVFG